MFLLNNQKTSKKRLKHFVRDGVGASVCEGFAETNFQAFTTTLHGTADQLGMLSSLQNLTACWLQLWSEKLVNRLGSRKRLVVLCVSAQVAILALMFAGTIQGLGVFAFMALMLAFSAIGGLSGPVWSSWVSELLPSRRRGFCFGVRNQRTYPAQFAALIAGGLILQQIERLFGGARGTQIAFCTVFAVGLTAKVFSLHHLTRQPEGLAALPKASLGPFQLLKVGYQDLDLRKIILFCCAMGFAINLSGPFQAPYLLQTLKLSYFQFASATAALVIARFLAAPHLGRILDRVGYQRPLLISSLLMPCIPLGYCLSKGYAGILMTQFMGGFIWTVFDLSLFSFLTDSTGSEHRQRAFALKQVSWSLAAAAGAAIGALIVARFHLPVYAFWASTVGRFAAAVFVVWMLTQVATERKALAA